MADPWADRAYLRDSQYKTDANLAARQSIYTYQHPRLDLFARVLDLAGPMLARSALAGSAPSGLIVDVGCGNGNYEAELARRGFPGRVLGVDLSLGMLAAARQRLGGLRPAGSSAVPPVALASADAVALPLPDGAAVLALAPHMLYHVPDPAAALVELRRITRPGGQVILVLNGAGHLRQLRAARAAARGIDPAALGERVTLDDAEALAGPLFARVDRTDFVAELRVPAPEPVADYVRSLAGTGRAADRPDQVTAVLDGLPRTSEGHYVITSHAGALVCSVG